MSQTAIAVPDELKHNERSKKLCRILESAGFQQIEKSLPRALGLNPTRFLQQIFTSIQTNPTLSQCEPVSLTIACVKAAQAGIPIDGVHGALVPFRDDGVMKAQFIPMYQGLMQAALRSGLVQSFRPPRAVYEGDEFNYSFGLDETLVHRPAEDPDNQNWANLKYTYCVATLKGSTEKSFVVIPKIALEATRLRSKSKNGPWLTDTVAMALKTAVRNLCKFLPKSADDMAFVAMLQEDENFDAGIAPKQADDAFAKLIEAETIKSEVPAKPTMNELAEQVVRKRKERVAKEPEPEPEPDAPPANNETFTDQDDAATNGVNEDTGEIAEPEPPKPAAKPKLAPLPPATKATMKPVMDPNAATPATMTVGGVEPQYDFDDLPDWAAWRKEKVGGNSPISAKDWDSLLGAKSGDWVHKTLLGMVRDANARGAKGGAASGTSKKAAYILARLNELFAV